MIKVLFFFAVCFITMGSLSAQSFLGKINSSPNQKVTALQNDTVKILAVMVNFQEDRDGATFGNGKFGSIYTKDYGNHILDPLPHDTNYFESHLAFVKNYFNKVSNGKVIITFTILPDTFSVSKTMRNYSPVNNSSDYTPLGQFSEEVWTKADELNPGFNFSDYNVFLILHAGVGRDVSLPGSLGNERDLPSIYLNENALKNIFGQSFDGFPVSNGTFRIYNSMIIPETESRELEGITGSVLFEITTNGLLVASVASYLGLPDLFDTVTGLSAIGRFGLMDGQSIFAYNGVFPPEPSAWEKIYLGWESPLSIDPGKYNINLLAKLAASLADTVILKVPLNSSEYYLIENRQRDVFKDGANLTINSDGNILTKTFLNDTTGFYSYNVDSLFGVITDVDEYDWALPGNGIVIWHIDQNIIDENLASNTINNDKERRGVDVEEADGVQDIGETFITIFGDQVVGEGTAQDFWYAGNKAKLYENIFDKNSRPNTNTNTGANSLITIRDFSSTANKMSFRVEYGDSLIKPIFSSQINFQSPVYELSKVSNPITNQFCFLIGADLKIFEDESEVKTIPEFSSFKISTVLYNNTTYYVGALGNKLNVYMDNGSQQYLAQLTLGSPTETAPLIVENSVNNYEIMIGTDDHKVISYSLGSLPSIDPDTLDIQTFTNDIMFTKVASDGSSFVAIGNNLKSPSNPFSSILAEGFEYTINNEIFIDLALSKNAVNNAIYVALSSNNNFYVFVDKKLYSSFNVSSSSPINSFSLVDLKQDGNNYIVFTNGKELEARNLSGASADHFPLFDPQGYNLVGNPLAMDFEGGGGAEIISYTVDGRILAFDGLTGKIVDGFPISGGDPISVVPVLFNSSDKTSLALINNKNYFSKWNIGPVEGTLFWSEKNGNNQNSSYIEAAKSSNYINQFFPVNRAYNYPNPVYGGETSIRYYVNEDSRINIKIFDLAGSFVAELNSDAKGGFDNETVWKVGDIQSGVYLARIEATGVSGKTESTIIKIAVVK
jgi:hypothetical protein